MQNLFNYNVYAVAVFAALAMLAIYMVINLSIVALKANINKKFIKYIYAFSSGVLIVAALLGLFQEGTEFLDEGLNENIDDGNITNVASKIIKIFLIVFGFTIGILVTFGIRKWMHRKHKHEDIEKGSHSHFVETHYEHETKHGNKKNNILSVVMILSHGIPEGLSMGLIVFNGHKTGDLSSVSWAALIAFTLHNTVDSLLLYFTLRHSGRNKMKSLLWASISVAIFIPLMLIGAGLGQLFTISHSVELATFWIIPLIFYIVTAILMWELVSELIPEFIHVRDNSISIKNMIITFMFGLVLTLVVFGAFGHSHGSSHDHNHLLNTSIELIKNNLSI